MTSAFYDSDVDGTDNADTSWKPFGPPDGGRADLNSLAAHFVRFSNRQHSRSGLGMDGGDRGARVIVGRKGAGKTLYLRRLQAHAVLDNSLYADDFQQSLPRTADIVKVCHWYAGAINAEKWMAIWKAAILRSLVSHILCSDRLQSAEPLHELDLRDNYRSGERRLYDTFDAPHSIYSQLSEIILDHSAAEKLDRYIYNPAWESLEYKIVDALKDLPPVCFYVDAIDEEFRHAPRYWLMCQKGLFYQVMRFIGDGRIGGRLHIVICIRDHVYSSTQDTEHATRYLESPYIRILDWNRDTIRHFLSEKIRALDPGYMIDPTDPTVAGWLGVKKIHNAARNVEEDVETYIVRHTRLIPRDVVVVGNRLSEAVASAKAAGRTQLDEEEIRTIVRRSARSFGREQLAICANQIASDLMPVDAAALGYENIYTGEDAQHYDGGFAFHDSLLAALRKVLQPVRSDRFGPQRLDDLETRATDEFGAIDVLSILWQNGLLGYTDGSVSTGQPVFYHVYHQDELELPKGKRGYVFHPVLIDTLDGLREVGSPVVPSA